MWRVPQFPHDGKQSHNTETGKGRPLDGFRVLDLSRFLSGPYAAMTLGDMGADVIKVEQSHTGDDSRRMAPKIDGESYPFAMPNRSKRSVSLDLNDRQGPRARSSRLAAEADLVIENFRPASPTARASATRASRRSRDDIL